MNNRKTPSRSGEHRAPTSAHSHQLQNTTTHEAGRASWEGVGEKTEMEMGKNRGKGRRKEDFYLGIWEKARKQRNYGRRSKLRGPSSWHCLTEVTLQSTGVGHLRPTITSSLFSYKEEVKEKKMGGLRYRGRRHKVTEVRREAGRGGRQLSYCIQRAFPSLSYSCGQRVLALQSSDACRPKGGKKDRKVRETLSQEGIFILLKQK